MNRRRFLAGSSLTAVGLGLRSGGWPDLGALLGQGGSRRAADLTLRIAPVTIELAPGHVVRTVGYNGTSPGPLVRVREGTEFAVDVTNELAYPELVHWHGQLISPIVDGASEEGTPPIPAGETRRYTFTPSPAGTRWYHTHTRAGSRLDRSLYSGLFGFFYVEPKSEPGRYDHEVFLALREWDPFFTNTEEEEEDPDQPPADVRKQQAPADKDLGKPNGLEVGYRRFSINDRALGHGEPIRVKEGERMMVRLLNASATEVRRIALAGHRFTVVALDGNPVPNPQSVETLFVGPAERIDAVVEMNQPGVWVLGTTHDEDRTGGMGVVVEYAGQHGPPVWRKPENLHWDYTAFGGSGAAPPRPDDRIELVFRKRNGGKGGFNRWTINDKSYPEAAGGLMPPAASPTIDPIRVHEGGRYRLAFRNESDDQHPIHIHRHLFELVSIDGRPTAGVMKDTVVVKGFGRVEVDLVANNPGHTLFHCHQQLHMDYGFMTLIEYAS